MKILVEVFDPAMCCSTGVCGPDAGKAGTQGKWREKVMDLWRLA